MKYGVFLLMALLLLACEEEQPEQQKEPTIIQNLPTQDRDFLLEPLERALDDLRSLADDDPSLEEETIRIDSAGWQGKRVIGTRDGDTLRLFVDIQRSSQHEKHWQYWDNEGELFYLESVIRYLNDSGEPQDQISYKMYLEEGGVMISSYVRRSYNGEPLPEKWRSSTFSPEEMTYILRAGSR